jgi:transcriptional regulator with XRE-family HTH domain
MSTTTTVRVDGAALRELRVASGHDLDAFALLTGISRPYLSLIETGHRHNVSPSIFARLCALLGVAETPELLQSTSADTSEPAA